MSKSYGLAGWRVGSACYPRVRVRVRVGFKVVEP